MENRKTQILDLTMKLIREKGYVAISYDDLAKQLGVTKASIHYHYEKKEDLGVAVAERLYYNLQNLSAFLRESSLNAEEKLSHYFKRKVEVSGTGICPISSLQADFESIPETLRQKVQEVSEFELSILEEILREASDSGIMKHEDVESVALAVLSCLKGAMQYKRALGKDVIPQVMHTINRLIRS
ncbi:TetR/AcrR family transcriptional regulator [Paenibacillus sp. R14(2021)]|uniref:TetR/AcrR family transcriptional regulator n=1 Tax=Paenibacillus sp. R14(2021) TaxID=2859228 RepID=UPI001C61682C|nr:TetR/AcrR family transcriptional regulator [Paenibacillus sp. R14(2021)]